MEPQSIEQLLSSLHLEKYIPKFKEEEITLESAHELGEDDFKGLGMPLGPRKALIAALSHGGGAHQGPPDATQGGGGGGGFDKSTVHARWPPVNLEAATSDSSIELEARKDLRNSKGRQIELEKRLQKAFGTDWYFSWDWGKIYHDVKTHWDKTNADSRAIQVCYRLGTYFLGREQEFGDIFIAQVIYNLEELSKDAMNKAEFISRCPAHVLAVCTDPDYKETDYYDRFGRFSFVDGAFLVTYNPSGLATDDFTTTFNLIKGMSDLPPPASGPRPQSKGGPKFPPVDPQAAMADSSIGLKCRQSIRENLPHLKAFEEKLHTLLGPEWYFSFDYYQICCDLKAVCSNQQMPDISPRGIHGKENSYLYQLLCYLEDFCQDEFNMSTFVAKCPTHAYVFRTTTVYPETEVYGRFDFKEGAFVVTIPAQNFLSNISDIAAPNAMSKCL